MKSDLETGVDRRIRILHLPEPVCEYRFAPPRQWRIDRFWKQWLIGLEIEGGVWTSGRHTRGLGFIEDCDKYNEAALRGIRIFRVTEAHVHDGRCSELLEHLREMMK